MLAAAAIVAWGLLLLAGGGPLLPALSAFALGVVVVLTVFVAYRWMALRREREHLERLHESFVTDAAHQLRTPLAALRLRMDELGERLDGTPLAATAAAGDAEGERPEVLTRALRAGE